MEKEKVLGIVTIPVTTENVRENKKPELPDDIWQQMRNSLQQSCVTELAEQIPGEGDLPLLRAQALLGLTPRFKRECFIADVDAKEIERNKVTVMDAIMLVFDCNIVAARYLTNTLILCGMANDAIRLFKDNFIPELFQNVEKWKMLREILRDQVLPTVRREGSKYKCVRMFPKAPFEVCFC